MSPGRAHGTCGNGNRLEHEHENEHEHDRAAIPGDRLPGRRLNPGDFTSRAAYASRSNPR